MQPSVTVSQRAGAAPGCHLPSLLAHPPPLTPDVSLHTRIPIVGKQHSWPNLTSRLQIHSFRIRFGSFLQQTRTSRGVTEAENLILMLKMPSEGWKRTVPRIAHPSGSHLRPEGSAWMRK